jgi:hypothetical protein
MRDLWKSRPGFLVGGGPSLRKLDYKRLGERGIVSIAVNNVAGFAPVRGHFFSDGQDKFHSGCFLDPAMLSLVPIPKLDSRIRVKTKDGRFALLDHRLYDCPNTFGFARSSRFCPDAFFDTWYAHWGLGNNKKMAECEPFKSMLHECEKCWGSGRCPHCAGKECEKCLQTKRGNATGKCKPCGGVGLQMPFKRLATILLGFRLLHYLGCRRVYLVGVDLHKDSQDVGEAYAFNERGSGGNKMFVKEDELFCMLRPVFDERGFHVANCSPDTHSTAFEKVSFDDAIADCKGAVPGEPFDLAEWYSKKELTKMRDRDKCPDCGGDKRKRRRCQRCKTLGILTMDIGRAEELNRRGLLA